MTSPCSPWSQRSCSLKTIHPHHKGIPFWKSTYIKMVSKSSQHRTTSFNEAQKSKAEGSAQQQQQQPPPQPKAGSSGEPQSSTRTTREESRPPLLQQPSIPQRSTIVKQAHTGPSSPSAHGAWQRRPPKSDKTPPTQQLSSLNLPSSSLQPVSLPKDIQRGFEQQSSSSSQVQQRGGDYRKQDYGGGAKRQPQQPKEYGQRQQRPLPHQPTQRQQSHYAKPQTTSEKQPPLHIEASLEAQKRTSQKDSQQETHQEVARVKHATVVPESSLDLVAPQRKKLKSGGTAGRLINIETNHLLLKLPEVDYAMHYDVVIEPDKPKRLLGNVMEAFRKIHYPGRNPAFDGVRNMYSPNELPFGNHVSGEVSIDEDDRPKTYKVTVNFATKVDLTVLKRYFEFTGGQQSMINTQKALQCIDVVLRSAPSLRLITVGRSFFTIPRSFINLGDGMQMYYGFFQSAILGWKPFLNVDVSHKAFPKSSNIIDLIRELCPRCDLDGPMDRRDFATVDKFLRTLKVHYVIPNNPASRRVMRVNQLDRSAREATFKLDSGKDTTVEQYFNNDKRYRLRYPNLPCLWVGSKTRETKLLFPAELCSIVEGQVTNRAMTPNQTSAMIKRTATSTDDRKKKIMESIGIAGFNENKSAQEFGISVGQNFETVKARVLEPPTLCYANRTVTPHRGTWNAQKFMNGIALQKWCIFCVDRIQPQNLQRFADMMIQEGAPLGMQIAQPTIIKTVSLKYGREKQELEQYFMELKEMQLILVVISEMKEMYYYVKQTAELIVGVLTQCVYGRNVYSSKSATVKNILLKVNAKLNGVNHNLQQQPQYLDLGRPTMIMGADVTHPSPDKRGIEPSVVAVTASHDLQAFQYNICWTLQQSGKEIIVDLANMVKKQLMFFYIKNRLKPERIIFFRDGVSEGEFRKVLNAEVQAIRQACTTIQKDGNYNPKITFLVVQKRHHTRFFPINPRDSEDKNGNVPAGTVVDTDITHPTELDFYLVSHASIQGVARPTKYRMLWDENDMTENVLEQLTFHLCHMFTRCTRSVSYPAPTYYAHLAAARAKVYCEKRFIDLNNLKKHQEQLIIKPEILNNLPMFFV